VGGERGVEQDRRAVGGSVVGTGDQEHPRGDVGLLAVRVANSGFGIWDSGFVEIGTRDPRIPNPESQIPDRDTFLWNRYWKRRRGAPSEKMKRGARAARDRCRRCCTAATRKRRPRLPWRRRRS